MDEDEDTGASEFLDTLVSACQLVQQWPEKAEMAAASIGVPVEDLREVVAAYEGGGIAAVAAFLAPAS